MFNAEGLVPFLKKRVAKFGICTFILVAVEEIVEEDFVCPCKFAYNITVCVFYGAIPCIACFLLTYFFMDLSLNTDGQWKEISKCFRVVYSFLIAFVWLFLFFADGRYLACAFSTWEGVYARAETLGIDKWCEPTGNGTTVLESQQTTLKWISISQIVGFSIFLLVVVAMACAHKLLKDISQTESDEESRVKLQGQPDERDSPPQREESSIL